MVKEEEWKEQEDCCSEPPTGPFPEFLDRISSGVLKVLELGESSCQPETDDE